MLKLFNRIAKEDKTTASMKEANIIVIPKKGKDPPTNKKLQTNLID